MTCNEFNNLMIDCIEGHLSFRKKRAIKTHLNHCSKCQTALHQYKDMLVKLHRVPQLKCPDEVVERIFKSINIIDKKESYLIKIYEFVSERFSWKLSYATAIAVIIIMIFIFYPDQKKSQYEQTTYTAEEIEQAKNDVELALGYLHHYAKKTGGIIEDQVLSKPIVEPIKSTMKIAFKPLLNGGKL